MEKEVHHKLQGKVAEPTQAELAPSVVFVHTRMRQYVFAQTIWYQIPSPSEILIPTING